MPDASPRPQPHKGLAKSQKLFVAKNHDQNRGKHPAAKDPKNPTLSNSLRQSLSRQSDAATAVSSSEPRAASDGRFVKYLPQDEAVAAGLGAEEGGLDAVESQRVVDLLNMELSRLLKLSPKEFWREVASDTSLHEFLDSFLQFRSRWYDFPHRGAKETVAGVIVGELELSRRVFMVLYRISSNRDPGARSADCLSSKDHGILLQEKKLLDLPKLLDICSIYGHENEDLTRVLVRNAITAQPWIYDSLTSVISQFLSLVHTMHQRCSSSLEVLFSSGSGDPGSNRFYADMLEVMDFINDGIVSMDALVNAYRLAALFFSFPVEMRDGNEELLCTLAKLHDSLIPSFMKGFRILMSSVGDSDVSHIRTGFSLLASRIIKFGWNVLDFCYLSDEAFGEEISFQSATKMFPANIEDPSIRADILVQTFREISAVSISSQENQNRESFLQNIEKNFNLMSKLRNLRNTGWIFMDDEQLEYVSKIFMSSKNPKIDMPDSRNPTTSKTAETNEDTVIMESKISQIKDLFPDFGKGFLAHCLEVYNQNPEEVIQRILEGTLHEDLQRLDTSLETMPAPKAVVISNKNDKGKGIMVESAPAKPANRETGRSFQQNIAQPVSSSSSSVGRYVRKGKEDAPDFITLDSRNEKASAKTAALVSQYEYEDEYDDSFDDLGLSVAESGFLEPEISTDKTTSNRAKPWEREERETETPPQNPSDSSKWGSRKKPQYYVKDGKNYSYKVEGSVAVANSSEASLVNQAQEEMIHGLGCGGNLPLGAVKQLIEASGGRETVLEASEEGKRLGNGRERGGSAGEQEERENNRGSHRGRGGARWRGWKGEKEKQTGAADGESREDSGGNQRGRGRSGRGRGNNNFRKDKAAAKHFSGVTGF